MLSYQQNNTATGSVNKLMHNKFMSSCAQRHVNVSSIYYNYKRITDSCFKLLL